MTRERHRSVPLGSAQPPFPGGWVSALLRAVVSFAPDFANRLGLPKRHRTWSRLEAGSPDVTEARYQEWKRVVVRIIEELFPRVSGINGFAAKYVDEYFRLWAFSAEHAARWVEIGGDRPASQAVLSRALVRDLLLRLCYLASCERQLAGSIETLFLPCTSFEELYRLLADRRKRTNDENLASDLKVSSRTLSRWRKGTTAPSWANLQHLAAPTDGRIAGGVGFIDSLLRRLDLRSHPLANELLRVAAIFMQVHPAALTDFRGEIPLGKGALGTGPADFANYAQFGDNLLLHPGWQAVRAVLPDALWRTHWDALRLGRPFDLAQLHLRFSGLNDDADLQKWITGAELQGWRIGALSADLPN